MERSLPTIVKGGYYLTQPRKPWLVNGMIREGTTVFLSGKEGTGKSIIALELAYCVAENRVFFGNGVSQRNVLYVAAERGDAQRERLEALRDLKGVNPDSVQFLDAQFKFNHRGDEEAFYETVSQSGITPQLIIIDTLRASFIGDENSSAVAQSTMDAFSRIRRRYNATVVVIHHVNAFGESRGSSAFIGAADTELYVTNSKSTGRVYLTVRKQNNAKNWLKYTLTPQSIEFGNDYSSIVLNHAGEIPLSDAPDSDDEDGTADENILQVLADANEEISPRRLHDLLTVLEGSMRNKNNLNKDVDRLVETGKVLRRELENGRSFLSLPKLEQKLEQRPKFNVVEQEKVA